MNNKRYCEVDLLGSYHIEFGFPKGENWWRKYITFQGSHVKLRPPGSNTTRDMRYFKKEIMENSK